MSVRILYLAADPGKRSPLDLAAECRTITQVLQAANVQDRVELITRWAVTPDDLMQYLHQDRPHVVHFSGHGTANGDIILKGKNGRAKRVSVKALGHLFAALKGDTQLVFLNACYLADYAEEITRSIDCVVGMSRDVLDKSAIIFAGAFYQAIGFEKSVQAAIDCGVAALHMAKAAGVKAPVLSVRAGVDPTKKVLSRAIHRKSTQAPAREVKQPQNNSNKPCLMARFREQDGYLIPITEDNCPEYAMEFWIEDAPEETKTVFFEIMDEGFRDRKWEKRRKKNSNAIREFSTDDMSAYGDVEIWVQGTGKGMKKWVTHTTLYDALMRYYRTRNKNQEIRRALKQIKEN